MTLRAGVLLYVEDEDAAYFLFEQVLRKTGVELRRAVDGEEALRLLREADGSSRPDLVVLNLNLPRKGGLDVLAELQTDAVLRQMPVVVFSSSSLAADRRRALELGARDYLTKPFSYDGFLEAVDRLCSYLPAA